jgi:hypothetical protein
MSNTAIVYLLPATCHLHCCFLLRNLNNGANGPQPWFGMLEHEKDFSNQPVF